MEIDETPFTSLEETMSNCATRIAARVGIAALVVSALATSSASAAVSYSDNFDTNTLSNYNVPTAPGDVTYSATAGTSGGGGLAASTTGNSLPSIISKTGYTVASGDSLDLSYFVQKGPGGFGGVNSVLFLGISDQDTYSWGGNPAAGKSVLGLVVTGYGQLGTRTADNGGSVSNANLNPTATTNLNTTSGNWYKLSATITKPTSGNNWTISGQFQDWGSTGTTPGAVLLTLPTTTVTFNSASFNSAATLNYGQMGVRTPYWSGVDNFAMVSPVPEPSTMALCGVGALALASRRRR